MPLMQQSWHCENDLATFHPRLSLWDLACLIQWVPRKLKFFVADHNLYLRCKSALQPIYPLDSFWSFLEVSSSRYFAGHFNKREVLHGKLCDNYLRFVLKLNPRSSANAAVDPIATIINVKSTCISNLAIFKNVAYFVCVTKRAFNKPIIFIVSSSLWTAVDWVIKQLRTNIWWLDGDSLLSVFRSVDSKIYRPILGDKWNHLQCTGDHEQVFIWKTLSAASLGASML